MFKKIFKNFKNRTGQSLVELLIAMGLVTLIIPAILTGIIATRAGRPQHDQRVQAVAIMKNAQEAVRSMAERDWVNVEANGIFHPVISGNNWILSAGTQTINNSSLSVVISDVQRDSGGAIVESGGTVDPSTKKVVYTVSWTTPLVSSVTSTNYLTRHTNQSHVETTLAEFTQGSTSSGTTSIALANTSGGEIVLGAGGGGGDWCAPTNTLDTEDLPKSGVANAIYAIEGKVAAGTGDNASGVSFASVDITTTHPPSAVIQETFDGYKTNEVFGEEDYAYLATDTNGKEIVIINLNAYSDSPTNSKYQEAGYFDAPGNGDGNAIFTSGNYGYMTSGNKFYIFDLSSKSGSRAKLNTSDVTLSGTGIKIIVNGGYAYVATTSTSNQLQIIDVSNPISPSIVGQVSVTGQGGRGLALNSTGSRAYLATGNSASQNEFFIINTTTKNLPALVTGGVYNTNGMDPKGVAVVTGNRAIIVGTGGTNQYQVINIANENAPVNCGNMVVSSGINGVSAVLQSNGYAYSYIITGDSASELKIILGGAGAGSNYNSSGVFESIVFDAGREVAWNSISVTADMPASTTLSFKVAVKAGISNSCSTVVFSDSDFVGPDGLSSSSFTQSGGLLAYNLTGTGYRNPGRCAKYRAYLDTTDSTQTPVVYDVSLNYSP